ncbi:MAG: LptF/LptG family permease [Bacteroidetes bacterium]|nr:LptF/LptG family permease [Bacteroidota bacterium]
MKKLHTLTLKSFLPPFIATLLISVFLFFLVQIVITYLDDLLGKGLRTVDLVKLFVYAWVAIIPQCIPLAVLLASIMSFGNLAEHYELAAMKSAGLSLFRIIKPAFGFILVLAGITFLFNNYILPVVHLKSQSLLYDIRQKKPTFALKEGIFYDKIENYSLRIGKKSANKDTLKDIYIYDHTARKGNIIQLYAKSGRHTQSADSNDLILILQDGNRYEELFDSKRSATRKPLSQLNFKQLQVSIDVSGFKFNRTKEELFKGHEEMLNIWQLDSVIDSTLLVQRRRMDNLNTQSAEFFYSRTASTLKREPAFPQTNIHLLYDSLNSTQFSQAIQNALTIARAASGNVDSFHQSIENEHHTLRGYLVEWHKKIVVCFACIILFFIGAPLGAIIKKGGLGLPVVISVLFFLAYYILTELFMSMAYDGTLQPLAALWLPLVIFLPISVFLTYKAAHDSAMFDLTAYYIWFEKLFKKKKTA